MKKKIYSSDQLAVNSSTYPDSLYGVSKVYGENIGKLHAYHSGLECITLRIGWIRENDDPSDLKGTDKESLMRAIYLSHKDCIKIITNAFFCDIPQMEGVGPYLCLYAISNNSSSFYDMSAFRWLGYYPVDDCDKKLGIKHTKPYAKV